MQKKDIIVITIIITVMIFILFAFSIYVQNSVKEVPPESVESIKEKSLTEQTKDLFGTVGVDLEKTQGVNRTYIGDEDSGIVVDIPRNPMVGGEKDNIEEYNSIVDVLYMFEVDLNTADGTTYFGMEDIYYPTKDAAKEFLNNFFDEDIEYTSRVIAYTKLCDGIYYVKAEFYQLNYGELTDISDFSKVMELTVNINDGLVYPSKYVVSDVIDETIKLTDCSVQIIKANRYVSELFVGTKIVNKSNEDFNFKDRYDLIAKFGKMQLDKGFDIYFIDYQLNSGVEENLTFKYVCSFTLNELNFEINKLTN